jgi:protein-S-isoprenylcysteine O-methyltransferase Ste14
MTDSKIRHAIEALLSILLTLLQNIVYGGYCISVMTIPLFAYLISLGTAYPNLERDMNLLLFSKEFVVGRIIALVGLVIFILSAAQLLRGYAKHVGLVKTGFYSAVRHPQYTGIIVVTLGLTVMVLTLGNAPQPVFAWLLQVLGYIILARYEEWHLERKYVENYLQYKQHVPFMLPFKCPFKISETLFTILLSAIVTVVLFLFPFNSIRFS